MMDKRLVVILCCLVCSGVALAANEAEGEQSAFLRDIGALSERDDFQVKTFDEQMVGLDNFDDKFFFVDTKVSANFKRNKFTNGVVTLAGQTSDATGRRAQESSYPFAVVQRSTKSWGTTSDRWDVKDSGSAKDAANSGGPQTIGKVEFFAIYHGEGKDFVVNKVRAHLLRKLANALQEHVPILDRSMQPDAEDHPDEVNDIHDEIRRTVENVFNEVDGSIRHSMYQNDDASAHATVVMVTETAIVTASVGDGQVLGYAGSGLIKRLTNAFDSPELKNVFGAMKSRKITSLRPHVEIFPRFKEDEEIQMILIESPTVAQHVQDYVAFTTVMSEVNKHKGNGQNEQHIFDSSLGRIVEMAANQGSSFERLFNRDLTAALIVLETNYQNIH